MAITRKADPHLHVLDRHDSPGLCPEPLVRYVLGCRNACCFHGRKARFHFFQINGLIPVPMDCMPDFVFCPPTFEPNIRARAIDDVPVLPTSLETAYAVAVL